MEKFHFFFQDATITSSHTRYGCIYTVLQFVAHLPCAFKNTQRTKFFLKIVPEIVRFYALFSIFGNLFLIAFFNKK